MIKWYRVETEMSGKFHTCGNDGWLFLDKAIELYEICAEHISVRLVEMCPKTAQRLGVVKANY